MTDVLSIEIPETIVAGKRLGRNVLHDPASRGFAARRCADRVSVIHSRKVGPFDQGDIGACTGNAIAGLLMTAPFWVEDRALDEEVARTFYSLATRIQGGPSWPDDGDPGSSGLAVAKAARDAGFISGFENAFGLDHVLDTLVALPVIVGVNWYDSFDEPDSDAMVAISPNAGVRGGHEFELLALDVERSFVTGMNSWGAGYGHGGLFSMSFDTLGRLLDEQGDCTTVA